MLKPVFLAEFLDQPVNQVAQVSTRVFKYGDVQPNQTLCKF